MEHQHSSIHAAFTSGARNQFLAKTKGIVPSSSLYKPDEMGYTDDPHVTILTGLEDANPPICATDIIETYPKFNITVGTLSIFKGSETGNPFDILKANINSSDVYALNTALSDSCPHVEDFPEYIPHATIAFVQLNTVDHLDGARIVAGISFMVDHLVYSSFNGTKRLIPLGLK